MLAKILTIAALFLSFDIALAATADKSTPPRDEIDMRKDQLKALSTKLDAIRYPIERYNLGGWVVLQEQIKAVIDSIDRNHGVGNDETSEAYKELVFQIESLKDYFQAVETPGTASDILAIQTIKDEIKAVRKMKDTIYARNTLRMFTKIKGLIETLKAFPISAQLQTGLRDLEPQIVAVFSQEKAQGGDRPLTYAEGIKAVVAIRKLYPLLMEAGMDNQIFVTVSRIQGYVEQYAYIANMGIQQRVEDGH